jgi:hypothetical protein
MKSLHLTTLGANMTEVRYGTKYVLFSYQTPVAYMDEEQNVFVTSKKWSNTTSKHISKWVNSRSFTKVSQETIDNLVK